MSPIMADRSLRGRGDKMQDVTNRKTINEKKTCAKAKNEGKQLIGDATAAINRPIRDRTLRVVLALKSSL